MALLTPDPAIAKVRDIANTVIERNALFAPSLIRALLALSITDFDIGQREVVSVEQLGHFGGRQQGFGLGASIVRGFGAQTLNSGPEPVKGSEVRMYGHDTTQIFSAIDKGGGALDAAILIKDEEFGAHLRRRAMRRIAVIGDMVTHSRPQLQGPPVTKYAIGS